MGRRMMALLVVLLISGVFSLHAQVTTGTISGTVSDSSGAVLPGAKIEILNEGTGVSREVVADAAGHYSAPQLNVGNYRVTATMQGFQNEVRKGIELTVGREAIVDFKLQVGAVTESVEVTGEAPLVETTESTVSYLVNDQTMRDLPLNGRDMSQLILLNPGVSLSVNSTGANSYSGYGKRISIAGMRGEDNIYVLDGGLIGDFRRHIPAGPSGSLLGLESTQEFQILTNSLGAQYGRMLGGVFNAVSKSGSNQWHGDVYDYLRNSALDAANWADNARGGGLKAPLRRNQFGGTLGGPIKKDKMFFFLAYEGTREALTETLTTNTITAPARQGNLGATQVTVNPLIVPYLNQFPLPSPQGLNLGGGVGQFIHQFKQPTIEHFGQARLDYQRSASDSFFVRFSGSNSWRDGPASATGGAGSFPGFDQVSYLGTTLVTLSETHIFSPVSLNTARFHFDRVDPLDTATTPPVLPGVRTAPGEPIPFPPNISPGSGVGTYGGFDTAPTMMVSNRFTLQDDINITRGGHALQFGGLFERLQFNGSFWNRYEGVWTWASLANFLTLVNPQTGLTNEQTFRGAPTGYGTYERGFRSFSMAAYVQDNWRITPKLTLNLGLRWEPYTVPTEVNGLISNLRHVTDTHGSVGSPYWKNSSWKDVAPRLGFAWSPFAGGKTSIRGGAGLFYAPNDPNLYYTQMVRNPPLAYDFTIAGTGHFPDPLAEIAAQNTAGPGYAVPFDNMREQHSYQYNFSVQQQFGANNVVSVGYAGSRGIDLLSVGDINMPLAFFDGVSLAYTPAQTALGTGALVNPAYSSIILYANNSNSWYNGLLTSYLHRFSHGLQTQVSYTWSKGLAETDSGQTAGGVTGGGGRMKYPNDHHAQRGLSGYNFTNVFSFSYTYDLPSISSKSGITGRVLSGWETTGVVSLRSGQPQSVTTAVPSLLVPLAVTPASPNAVAGCTPVIHARNPNHYFETNCYTPPGSREIGNLARNTLMGPGAITWDPALFKKFQVTERINLEFRAEMFNVLNRANYGPPASSLYTAAGAPVAGVGIINGTTTSSRQIQFALKLLF